MKTTNTINILALLLSFLFFVGCEKDVNDERLRVTPEIIEIGCEGGTVQVDIESTSGWEVIVPSDCTWVKSDRYESEVGRRQWIKLSISKNKTESTRKATITIRNSGQSRQVAITQSALSFSVTPESIDVGADKTTLDISINSDISWSAKASDSWFSLSKNSGNAGNSKISVTIAKNTTGDARTGHVEIYNHDYNLAKSVTITQVAATIRVDSSTIEVAPEATTRNVTVTSDIDWTAKTSANWITLSKNSGSAGTTTLAMNIGANTSTSSRSGYVEFYNSEYNVSKRVDINQIAFSPELSVSPNSFDVGVEATTKTVTIESNISWTAKTSKSWIYVSKLSGSAGTTTLTIDIGANTSTSSRSGYVEFYNSEYNVSKRVDINQIAFSPELSVSPNSFDVGVEATTKTVTIESNISWTAKTSKSWIYVSKLSGSAGTTMFTIDIDANTSISSRSGYVEIFNEEHNISKRVTITQSALSFNVTPESIDVGAENTTRNITINSNISWSASVSDNWISLSKSSSSVGNDAMILTIEQNTTGIARTGYVEIYNQDYNVSKKVIVNQEVAWLAIDTESIYVGTESITKKITVESNIPWAAKTNANWITIPKYSGTAGTTILYVNIEANTTASSRTDYVTIYNQEYYIVQNIVVTQEGPVISVNTNAIEVGPESATRNIAITSNVGWIAQASVNWITLSKSSGLAGTTTLIVNVDANTSISPRSGYVEIYNAQYNVSQRFVVNQTANGVSFVEIIEGINLKMIFVEGGTFPMGSNDGFDIERPVHNVTLDSYYIGETEITQAQWQVVMGSYDMSYVDDNRAVMSVSWDDAQEFCRKLSELTGKRYVLPTEAQWEFAARGGNMSRGYVYSGSNSIGDVAVYEGDYNIGYSNVKSKQPNELGLYDMSGNVYEWCSDWYGSYGLSDQENPQGPASGSNRVLRGGSCYSNATYCRVASRSYDKPSYNIVDYGFRVVCLP